MSEMEKVRDAARQADGFYGEGDDVYDEAFDRGYAAAAAQSGWVDVQDRLPEYGGEYLVTVASSFVGLDAVETDRWSAGRECWQNHGRKVMSWMEMPPPYQREGDK